MKKTTTTAGAYLMTFPYARLRNELHVEFHTDANAQLVSANPETLGVKAQYDAYKLLLDLEIELLDQIRRSGRTPEIDARDHERDSLVHGFTDNVKSNLRHFDPGKRQAAEKLMIILDRYGNIAQKSLEEETAAIEDLHRELMKQENYLHVAALGLGEWLGNLVQVSRNLEELIRARDREIAQRPTVSMHDIRPKTDGALCDLFDMVNALARVNGESAYATFIAEMNATTERYREKLAREAGHRHPVKDLGKADHCVVEPIDTQKYTEKAVTPIPKAHWRAEGKPTVELVFAKDFSVTYTNNVEVGTADVTLHGTGDYSGKKTVTFNIAR
jgi:hypothetical protein